MKNLYRGQSAHLLSARPAKKADHRPWWQKRLFLFFLWVLAMGLVWWAAVSFLQIPYAHYSVSKGRIIAAYTADGKPLSISEVKKGRYELINVQ